ncbi:MAG: threonine ammonia-lyase [Planctomycetota bacterium]
MSERPLAISLDDVRAARERIKGYVVETGCPGSSSLAKLTGCAAVGLKLENRQRTRAFKARGAINRLLTLTPEEAARGIVAASAGNHAQGVALGARELGLEATIVMPEWTPLAKVVATRGYGAHVRLAGANYNEAAEVAQELVQAEGRTMVHAFDDPWVIAGQGTIGLEILEQRPDVEAVVVPIGGGGLIGGIATAIKGLRPDVLLIGVQTQALPSMRESLRAGEPATLPPAVTIADGIAVKRPGVLTFPIVRRHVDRVVTVSDEEIAGAILFLLEREKVLAEGAGAAGVAALLANKVADLARKKVVVVVSGGNLDMTLLSRVIERGLVSDGRLTELVVHLPDRPGALAQLTATIARLQANVLEITHTRAFRSMTLGEAEVDLRLETRGPEHVAELIQALRDEGFRVLI